MKHIWTAVWRRRRLCSQATGSTPNRIARGQDMSKRNQQLTFVFVIAAGTALLAGSLAYGQVLYGTVVGNVKDTTGAAVPGATVTIVNTKTNASRETVTNESGAFTVSNLLAGTYTVKIGLTGFKEFTQTDVNVSNNDVARV